MAQRSKSTPPFVREIRQTRPGHGWKVTPGYNICVIERGAIRFEYPNTWVHERKDMSIKLHDVPYPDDSIVLEVSVFRTPPMTSERNVNPSQLVYDTAVSSNKPITREMVVERTLPGVDIAWVDFGDIDSETHKPLIHRQCQCRPDLTYTGPGIYALMTYSFYVEVEQKANAIWEHLVQTIVMAQLIADPTIGPVYH